MFGKKNNKKNLSSNVQTQSKQDNYKKLKKLNKIELLTIIRQQKEENEILQKKYDCDISELKSRCDKDNKALRERMKKENESLKEYYKNEINTVKAQLELEKTSVRERYEKENEEFRLKIKELEEKLQNHEINIQEAGSIAEAAFRINCVMEIAQHAADDYVKNIRRMNDELQSEYSTYEIEAKAKAEKMLQEAAEQCEKMRQDARDQTDDIWSSLQNRFEHYYSTMHSSKKETGNVTQFKTRESM